MSTTSRGSESMAQSRPSAVSIEQVQPAVYETDKDEPYLTKFDKSVGTRTSCIIAVAFGAVLAVFCLIDGIYIMVTRPIAFTRPMPSSTAGEQALAMAINVVITICTDGMNFVHSVSLRWALFREGRLEYNTNIRLLTSSRRSGPNAWYSNLMAMIGLILTYAASSFLICQNEYVDLPDFSWLILSDPPTQVLNGVAAVALGIGLAIQAGIAMWCLVSDGDKIPTWSSNPLNNTLAALTAGSIAHQPNRCMMSVHQRHQWSNQEVFPAKRQQNMVQAVHAARYILALLWFLAALAVGWPIAITVVQGKSKEGVCWSLRSEVGPDADRSTQTFDDCNHIAILFPISPGERDSRLAAEYSFPLQAVLGVLFISSIQASQTIALHCAELIVNLSRDEAVWRRASIEHGKSKKQHQQQRQEKWATATDGARLTTSPFRAALSSWENAVLFVSKALLHWIIAQSMHPSIIRGSRLAETQPSYGTRYDLPSVSFSMLYTRLFIYAFLAILLACFGTYLACRCYHGYQPAAMGHVQTLADLVDDWRMDEAGCMWWGDKTMDLVEGEAGDDHRHVRHAGTSSQKETLGSICPEARYAGRKWNNNHISYM